MFVDIENPKIPLKVANILTAYDKGVVIKGVRQSPKKLTPKVCLDILKSTNYPRCIRDMLTCIAKLPDEEQAEFKEVVISAFDNREQPADILQLGQELAEKSGYGIEFAKAQKFKEGEYLYSDVEVRKCFMCHKSEFIDEDFSAYDKVVFLSDKKIQFGRDVKFPKNMDFPNSLDVSFYDVNTLCGCNFLGVQSICFKDGAKVNLSCTQNLLPNLDISMCDEVNLRECDLSEQSCLRFKDGAKVVLDKIKNLPPNLDVSCCDEVNLIECDLSEQSNLRFKEGALVDLSGAKNLPKNLDFSCCSWVYLSYCDLSEQPNLRFKDGAKVSLGKATNLPLNLDVSMCAEVLLFDSDLSRLSNLRFKKGAEVWLNYAKNFPSQLDFSQCGQVHLSHCDLSNVQRLVFKNRQQMKKSEADLSKNWNGKLVFTDEQEVSSLGLEEEVNTVKKASFGNQLGKMVTKLFGKGGR